MSAATPELPTSSRDKILDTAEVLFSRHGFAGVGLRGVADQVGMGKSSLFHHFPSKVRLYVAVIERVLGEFDESLATRAHGSGTAMEQLHRWCDVVVEKLSEHPTWAPLLLRSLFEADVLSGSDQAGIDAIFSRIVDRVSRALEQGVQAGELRPVSIPHTIQSLIGMTVFHFASGDLGKNLIGEPIYSARQISERMAHLHDYLDHALSPRTSPTVSGS